MATDLERLHAVLAEPYPAPRSGKTTALCHLIVGAIEMGEKRVHVLLSYLSDREHFLRILQSVLWEHGYSSNYSHVDGSLSVWHGEVVVLTCPEGFTTPPFFPAWDARRHARPQLIDETEYRVEYSSEFK